MAHNQNQNQPALASRFLDTFLPLGQAYIRFRFTEYWVSYKLAEVLVEGHKLYRKWRSVPKYVDLLRSEDASKRIQGVIELETVCLRNTGTRAFSVRSIEHGSLPGLISLLYSGSPPAVSASLCVLCDVYGHPACVSGMDVPVLKQVFVLTGADDLHCRLRASLFLALLATENTMEEKLQCVMDGDRRFLRQLTSLVRRPLPDRFQNALEQPGNLNHDTEKHLKLFESQVRKAGVTVLYKIVQMPDLLRAIEHRAIIPHLVKSVRDKDAGLRNASKGCLKSFAAEVDARRVIGESIARYWTNLMPKARDLDCISVIEDLGVHVDIRERLIQDIFYLHRLPCLLTSGKQDVKVSAFRSLFPFTLSQQHRWKVVKAGLLHLILDGLICRNKSVYIAAIICLSQLCVSREVFLAIQAEMTLQKKKMPPRVGEYLVYLTLCYPEEEIGQGALRLLREIAPRLKSLPADVLGKLKSSLFDKDGPHRAGTARLVSELSSVDKFRASFLDSGVVNDLLVQLKRGPEKCRSAMLEALATLCKDEKTARRVGRMKGLRESLWSAQETTDDDLAVAALELLRVLSKAAQDSDVEESEKSTLIGLPGCHPP